MATCSTCPQQAIYFCAKDGRATRCENCLESRPDGYRDSSRVWIPLRDKDKFNAVDLKRRLSIIDHQITRVSSEIERVFICKNRIDAISTRLQADKERLIRTYHGTVAKMLPSEEARNAEELVPLNYDFETLLEQTEKALNKNERASAKKYGFTLIVWLKILLAVLVAVLAVVVLKSSGSPTCVAGTCTCDDLEQTKYTGWAGCESEGIFKGGYWKEGKQEGKGYREHNLALYFGEFVEGKMSGMGLLFSSYSDFSVSKWLNDTRSGPGLSFLSDRVCHGSYKNDKFEGNTTCIEPSGEMYVGNYQNGAPNGSGKWYFPAEVQSGYHTPRRCIDCVYNYNPVYRLAFEAQLPEAKEASVLPKETSWLISAFVELPEGWYRGQLNAAGQRHGYGEQYFSKGLKYTGEWKNDLFDGSGRLYSGPDYYKDGFWKEGVLRSGEEVKKMQTIRGMWNAKGELDGIGMVVSRTNSTVRLGEFRDGFMTGQGVKFSPNGIEAGSYELSTLSGRGLRYFNQTPQYGQFLKDKYKGPAEKVEKPQPAEKIYAIAG